MAASSTYKGVACCQECAAPDAATGARAEKVATCTRCVDPKYLKDNECVADASACGDGYAAREDSDSGNRCVPCTDKTEGVTDCETCEYNTAASKIKCTKCGANKYLKTAADGTTTCEADCGEGYFGHTDDNQKKTCQSCATGASSLNPPVIGIEGCTSCIYTESGPSTLTCSECEQGKKPSLDGLHCYACAVDNCASCDENSVCQKCAYGYILDGAACTQQTCSTPDCKTCNNPKTASEACTTCAESKYLTPTSQCIADCAILSRYHGDADKTCKRCEVANCETCDAQGQCQTCSSGFYLDNSECKACDSSCKSCSGATASDCTECPAGRALKYGSDGAKGTCGEGYTTGTGQGACKACGLTVEGTKYCSACSKSDEYPQNGVCAPKTTRATDTCSDSPVSGGVCNACTDGYFRMNGGCYETGKYPGKSVCTQVAAGGGTCDSPAPGYNVDNGGTLVTCPEGCKTCSDASTCTACADGYVKISSAQTCTKCDASCLTCGTNARTCTACASGYYLSGSTCASCESNSGSITGVKGCASCAASTGSTGAVLCYLVGMVLGPSPHVPVGMSAR